MTKRLDPETKAANKIKFGKIRSERVKGVGNPFFGKHHTLEAIEKNRLSKLGKPSGRMGAVLTDETKEKIRKGHFGKPVYQRVFIQSDDPSIRCIPLTQNQYALIDAEDFERINAYLWVPTRQGRIFYAHRFVFRKDGTTKTETMHHAVLGVPRGGLVTDHINGDGLDNRKCNLRFVTNRENCQNRHTKKNSKYPGVYQKKIGKWEAHAQSLGKNFYLGCWNSEETAYSVYKEFTETVDKFLEAWRKKDDEQKTG